MVYSKNYLYDDNEKILIKTYHSSVSRGKRIYYEHHHTECELSLFISGNGIYATGNKEYPFSKGDIFLFGSDETHCITDIHSEIDLLNIHFEPSILWESTENIELLGLFSARNEKFSNIFSNDTKLKEKILKIENEAKNKAVGYKTEAKYALFSALIHILRNYDYTDKNEKFDKYSSTVEKIKDAISYINEHLTEKIFLSDIAETACMSQTYFSAVFKKLNGISPWDYITIKRIEMAIHLIKTSGMTKLEIAECCGFSSSSNFYKAFSKVTGKTPNDYLK